VQDKGREKEGKENESFPVSCQLMMTMIKQNFSKTTIKHTFSLGKKRVGSVR